MLLVDDEGDIKPPTGRWMRPCIRSGKYRFLIASDGVKAPEILSEAPSFDMIVTEINTPYMDGLSLPGRDSVINPNDESVVISAYGDTRNIRAAMNRGALEFFIKHHGFEGLEVVIRHTQVHCAS